MLPELANTGYTFNSRAEAYAHAETLQDGPSLKAAGIELQHVPYRGAAPGLNDLIPGRIDSFFNNIASNAVASAAGDVAYILQAGSFSASGDAEATKAKIAMLGLSARVESAQINGKTVYRVRMGPYGTAGELAEAAADYTPPDLPPPSGPMFWCWPAPPRGSAFPTCETEVKHEAHQCTLRADHRVVP